MDFRLKYPIKELLRRGIAGDYTRDQLAELHRLTYNIGRRFIRRRTIGNDLPYALIGLNEADIVHDCIAELFTRTDSGELIELSRYFTYRNVAIELAVDEELLSHFRVLVFSVVSDNFFRLLNEADPALGKVIRNLKLAAGKTQGWTIDIRFEDAVMVFLSPRQTHHEPALDPFSKMSLAEEILEPLVFSSVARESEVPAILKCLARNLEEEGVGSGWVRLMTLASMIRRGYERLQPDHHSGCEETLPEVYENLPTIIAECCKSVDSAVRSRYVDRGKVCSEVFDGYMKALERLLVQRVSLEPYSATSGDGTYLDSLRCVFPDVTAEEYANRHRLILEYLGKLVKRCLKEKLREA